MNMIIFSLEIYVMNSEIWIRNSFSKGYHIQKVDDAEGNVYLYYKLWGLRYTIQIIFNNYDRCIHFNQSIIINQNKNGKTNILKSDVIS